MSFSEQMFLFCLSKQLQVELLHQVVAAAAAAAKSHQSCPTLCDAIDGSPPGSPIRGILQARTLEWVAISFSNAWKWKVKVKLLSHVRLLASPWTAAYQAPPSMGFSRQESWSGKRQVDKCIFKFINCQNVSYGDIPLYTISPPYPWIPHQ